jgi:hypothetical protein
VPKARTNTKQVGTPSFDVRAALFGVLGPDLTQIHGLGPSLSLKLVGECGTVRGAPVVHLSQNASFHSTELITPSNHGIKYLEVSKD